MREVVVAVLGVDGAGKSTVLKHLLRNACVDGVRARSKHLRPHLIPPLGFFRGKGLGQTEKVDDPHGGAVSGPVFSMFRVVYLLLDYWLGWSMLHINGFFSTGGSRVLVFDRYAFDIAIDPRRFRVGLSTRTLWRLIHLAPSPDLIICLVGDAAIIAERKRELKLEEVQRQIRELQSFAARTPRACVVPCDIQIEATVENAYAKIRELLKG